MTRSRQPRVRSAGKLTKLSAVALAAGAFWLTPAREVEAQAAYPSQPIKVAMGFPAGTDGHTLVVAGNAAVVIQQSLRKLSYDPEKELAPISQLAATPNVLVVHSGLTVKTAQELAELARTNSPTSMPASASRSIWQGSSSSRWRAFPSAPLPIAATPCSWT